MCPRVSSVSWRLSWDNGFSFVLSCRPVPELLAGMSSPPCTGSGGHRDCQGKNEKECSSISLSPLLCPLRAWRRTNPFLSSACALAGGVFVYMYWAKFYIWFWLCEIILHNQGDAVLWPGGSQPCSSWCELLPMCVAPASFWAAALRRQASSFVMQQLDEQG